jgi:hypothetical protein
MLDAPVTVIRPAWWIQQ